LEERSEYPSHSQNSTQEDAPDFVNDFRAKNKRLLDNLSAADAFIKEYEPMLMDQKRMRKVAAKAIIFNLMSESGLHIEDLATDELDLTPSKDDGESKE
jgi:hypothetical protein